MRTTTHWIGTLVLGTMLVCLARQAQSTESDPPRHVFVVIVVAANEGRSYVDAVEITSGRHLDRLEASNPCCVERIPSQQGTPVHFLISNLGDGTIQVAEVSSAGKLKTVGKIQVGKALPTRRPTCERPSKSDSDLWISGLTTSRPAPGRPPGGRC